MVLLATQSPCSQVKDAHNDAYADVIFIGGPYIARREAIVSPLSGTSQE